MRLQQDKMINCQPTVIETLRLAEAAVLIAWQRFNRATLPADVDDAISQMDTAAEFLIDARVARLLARCPVSVDPKVLGIVHTWGTPQNRRQ